MKNKLLNEIMSIDGVQDAFLTSSNGEIIVNEGNAFNDKQIEQLSQYLSLILTAFRKKDKMINEMEFFWDEKYLICRKSTHFLLIAVCKDINMLPLLRITLNVLLAKFEDDKKILRKLKSVVNNKNLSLQKGTLTQLEKSLISKLN
jgi:hypothetical protein